MRFRVANPLPAAFLRGGTSKGVFINRRHLPAARADWDALFLRIMGSPDPRQLDGMGGGVSSLSKVVVVGPPSAAAHGCDVEYTFAQVGVHDAVVDYAGNCGNLSAMVGVFALDERICAPPPPDDDAAAGDTATVRAWNTNTRKEVRTTFPVAPGGAPALGLPQATTAGVPGTASRIVVTFPAPAGARTPRLLPTGRLVDALPDGTPCSLVDATNPTVFLPAPALFPAAAPHLPPLAAYADPALLARLEELRAAGARAMGLDPAAPAQPKLAIVGAPRAADADADVEVHAFSLGVLHRAVPVTVALCLGVAALLPGSVVHALARPPARADGRVALRHPGGTTVVAADIARDGVVRSAEVVRTGRRLMQGAVWW